MTPSSPRQSLSSSSTTPPVSGPSWERRLVDFSEIDTISVDPAHPARFTIRYIDARVDVFECLGCNRDVVVEDLRLYLRTQEDRIAEILPPEALEEAQRYRPGASSTHSKFGSTGRK